MAVDVDLREFSIFAGLSDEEVAMLAELARERHYAPGGKIIEKDDVGASMFLVREGEVRVVLPKHDGEDVLLDCLGPGDFCGEMSLFDGKPRSAVVIADTDATLIEIEREQFLKQIKTRPDMALRILAVMAERLRQSDARVQEIADRVYHAAYPRMDNAVTTQLEAAKVIYEKTEDRASRVLSDVERSWTTLTRFITIILGVASVIGATLAYLGYSEFNDARNEINADIEAIDNQRKEAKNRLDEINRIAEATKDASIAREIVLEIGRIRRDFTLDQTQHAETPEQIRRKAVQFKRAEKQLYSRYLENYQEWSPAVVLEAAIVYVDFIDKASFYPSEKKVSAVVTALIHVLENSDSNDWRTRLKVRDALVDVGTAYNGEWTELAAAPLYTQLEKEPAEYVEREIAMILSAIGETSGRPREILLDTMHQAKSVWTRFGAAVQLIRASEQVAWEVLLANVNNRDKESFVAAYLLAQLGPAELRRLGICKYGELVHGRDPMREVVKGLEWEKENVFSRPSANPYQKQYTEILLDRFRNSGYCSR